VVARDVRVAATTPPACTDGSLVSIVLVHATFQIGAAHNADSIKNKVKYHSQTPEYHAIKG
jgi:hypothetical protein